MQYVQNLLGASDSANAVRVGRSTDPHERSEYGLNLGSYGMLKPLRMHNSSQNSSMSAF